MSGNSEYYAGVNTVKIILRVARQSTFYVVSVMCPVYVIACLTVFAIFSPSNAQMERDEKVTVGLTAMLSVAVFLLMVVDWIPKTNEPFSFPLIAIFFFMELMMVFSATAYSIVASHIECHSYANAALPKWMECLASPIVYMNKDLKTAAPKPRRKFKKLNRDAWKYAFYHIDLGLMVLFEMINIVMVAVVLSYGMFATHVWSIILKAMKWNTEPQNQDIITLIIINDQIKENEIDVKKSFKKITGEVVA